MGRVMNRGLLKVAYEATARLLRDRPEVTPTQFLWGDSRFLRVIPMEFCKPLYSDDARLTQAVADNVRTIRDEKEDKNRWSGSGLGTAEDCGGLYLSLDSGALSAEIAHYNQYLPRAGLTKAPDVTAAFGPKMVRRLALFRLRPLVALHVVDFSKYSPGRALFFETLGRDESVRSALRASRGTTDCEGACRDGDDYSFSRGVALAVAGRGYDGILVRTARDNEAIRDDGNNVVLFGRDKQPHPKLYVENAVAPLVDKKGGMTLRLIGY
jgi:hypothetical protein